MKNWYLLTLITIQHQQLLTLLLQVLLAKTWEKFQPGMIMSGVFQIECVI